MSDKFQDIGSTTDEGVNPLSAKHFNVSNIYVSSKDDPAKVAADVMSEIKAAVMEVKNVMYSVKHPTPAPIGRFFYIPYGTFSEWAEPDDSDKPKESIRACEVALSMNILYRGYYDSFNITVRVHWDDSDGRRFDFVVLLDKNGDQVSGMPEEHRHVTRQVLNMVRDATYRSMNNWIKSSGPDSVSTYFFGNVYIESPTIGKRTLNSYIMNLNDSTNMTREEIADSVEEIMGDNVPRIPVNPMSWLIEPRQMVFVDDRRKDFDRMFDRFVTADKITADKIAASSLYFDEIPPPDTLYANVKVEDLDIKETSDDKKWFKVTGTFPPEVGITGLEGLSVDTPPEV